MVSNCVTLIGGLMTHPFFKTADADQNGTQMSIDRIMPEHCIRVEQQYAAGVLSASPWAAEVCAPFLDTSCASVR